MSRKPGRAALVRAPRVLDGAEGAAGEIAEQGEE